MIANFQVVCKVTLSVIAEGDFLHSIEERFKGLGHRYFIRNTVTGVEWDVE